MSGYVKYPVTTGGGGGSGTVTSIDVSGGTTGFTFTGGPITTSGVITATGTLNAAHGGTGQTAYTIGDILYASSTSALSKLGIGGTGQIITVVAGLPAWAPNTGAVSSISNSDGTLTISPTTGAAVASLNLANANTWTATQTVNLNSASAPSPITGTGIQIVGADATVARVEIDSFGAITAFSGRRANGTGASPTAILSGDQLGAFNMRGYYVTGGPGYSNPQVSIAMYATQNWTSTNQGTKTVIQTTPNNSTTMADTATFGQDGSLAVIAGITATTYVGTSTIAAGASSSIGWTGRTVITSASDGTLLFTNNAATGFTSVQYGPTVAAPSAVTLQGGSVVAGTSNTAGANFTYAGSQGTGTGAGGSHIYQVAPAGTTGTAQNALVTAVTIDSGSQVTLAAAPLASTTALRFNGAILTGGSATTNFPHILIQPTAASAVSSWSASGTVLGFNTSSGFAGNIIDLHANGGAALFTLSGAGTMTITGNINCGGLLTSSRNGSTSNGAFSLTGTIITGGTGTNNLPQALIQPGGTTAVSSWSTSGTGLGMNLASGFAGDFLAFHAGGGGILFAINSAGSATFADAANLVFGTTTGTKIGTATSQKIGVWNAAPIVQPTTAIAASTFVANTSGTLNDTATWDSYTIGQVVKALRNIGILA